MPLDAPDAGSPPDAPGPLTTLLRRWHDGDRVAAEHLFPLVYQELRALARRHMSRERQEHTLVPTALVHEAFLKMMGGRIDARDRLHFFALAATVMRQVLIDHAKSRLRQKRGGAHVHVTLGEAAVSLSVASEQVLDLDRALTQLALTDPRAAKAVELHYFAGLDYDETAEAMEASRSSVSRDLRFAKAWLATALGSA